MYLSWGCGVVLNCQYPPPPHLMQRWRGFRPAGLRSVQGYISSCKFPINLPLVFALSFSQHLAPARSRCLLTGDSAIRIGPCSPPAPLHSLQSCSIARPHNISPSPPVTALPVRWLLVNTASLLERINRILGGRGYSTLRQKVYRRPVQVTNGLFQGHLLRPPPHRLATVKTEKAAARSV